MYEERPKLRPQWGSRFRRRDIDATLLRVTRIRHSQEREPGMMVGKTVKRVMGYRELHDESIQMLRLSVGISN